MLTSRRAMTIDVIIHQHPGHRGVETTSSPGLTCEYTRKYCVNRVQRQASPPDVEQGCATRYVICTTFPSGPRFMT